MAVKPPATDPFALTGPKQIDAIVKRFVGMQGSPQTDAQIQASARAQVDPLVAALTKNVNDRAAASTQAIKGLTDSYAGELGRIDFGAPYDQAKLEQAAVSDSLRGALAGAGSDLASQLRARMAPIGGDPAVAEAASSLASRGADLGTTELARGSSALSSLIASGAAAESYGQKLPAIARLSGLQGVNDVNSRAVNDIASGSQDILGQLPSIVQALRNSRDNLRENRASMGANLYTTLTGQNVTKATAKAGLDNQAFDNNLAFAGTYGFDPNTGMPTVAATKATADAKAKATKAAKGPQITPNHLADMKKSAAKDAEFFYHGQTDKDGNVVAYTETYQDAVKMLASRYPDLPRSLIKQLVDQWYKPGEFGRPYKVGSKQAPGPVKGKDYGTQLKRTKKNLIKVPKPGA